MQVTDNKISVIIRSKNEERWLGSCLFAIKHQEVDDVEVVVVDNESTDSTVSIAKSFGCKIVTISDDEFNFSRALNRGIAYSSGDFIAIISSHCIPVDVQWLSCLRMHFENPDIAAVYGRQEPLPDTPAGDKRDLWTTFGLDRKIQVKDYFFHNANSMIRRNLWEKINFSEKIHGVEDRDWAKKAQSLGYKIVYEPYARVFHQHGIHHNGNQERTVRVVKMIEAIHKELA